MDCRKLSIIKQLDSLKIEWVQLNSPEGYQRFAKALNNLNIPYKEYAGNLEKDSDKIIDNVVNQ